MLPVEMLPADLLICENGADLFFRSPIDNQQRFYSSVIFLVTLQYCLACRKYLHGIILCYQVENMKIITLTKENDALVQQAAQLLMDAFHEHWVDALAVAGGWAGGSSRNAGDGSAFAALRLTKIITCWAIGDPAI